MTESALVRLLLLESSKLGVTLFRNQVGQYRLALPDCPRCQEQGRVLRSGLCVGSPDLVGWMPVTVTPEMAGQRLAVFAGIEAKRPVRGRTSAEQRAFLAALQRAGAVCGVVRSLDDLVTILKGHQ